VICRPEEGCNQQEEHEHQDDGCDYGYQQELQGVLHEFRLDRPHTIEEWRTFWFGEPAGAN